MNITTPLFLYILIIAFINAILGIIFLNYKIGKIFLNISIGFLIIMIILAVSDLIKQVRYLI